MDLTVGIAIILLALALGGAVGWFIRGMVPNSRVAGGEASHQAEIANLRLQQEQQLAAGSAELAEQKLVHERQLADSNSELARQKLAHEKELGLKQEEIAQQNLKYEHQLAEQQEQFAGVLLQHEQQLGARQEEIAQLTGQLEQVKSAQELLETAKLQFGETAKLTAAEALQANNKQFMELSEQSLGKTMEQAKGELEQRHRQFQELVKPLAENYTRLNPQIEQLTRQNQSLAEQTGRLSSALTDNRQAGQWGEVQLRRVIDLAGMTDYCDFAEQEALTSSQVRPDLVVRLPEKRAIVVDAKASTLAFMEAQQSETAEAADVAWRRHAQAMRRQVDDLGGKNYGAIVEGSLDFVVMFVPGDQFLAAALKASPGLIEYAMGKRVAIATPASLIAMLWAVANGWQQFRLAEDAARIKQVGDEMYKRLLTFMNHYSRVGRELQSAVSAYNQSVGSFDQRLAPQGRRFAELVVGNDSGIPALESIDEAPRVSVYASAEDATPVIRNAAAAD